MRETRIARFHLSRRETNIRCILDRHDEPDFLSHRGLQSSHHYRARLSRHYGDDNVIWQMVYRGSGSTTRSTRSYRDVSRSRKELGLESRVAIVRAVAIDRDHDLPDDIDQSWKHMRTILRFATRTIISRVKSPYRRRFSSRRGSMIPHPHE